MDSIIIGDTGIGDITHTVGDTEVMTGDLEIIIGDTEVSDGTQTPFGVPFKIITLGILIFTRRIITILFTIDSVILTEVSTPGTIGYAMTEMYNYGRRTASNTNITEETTQLPLEQELAEEAAFTYEVNN
jgi:hypothetical protein